jgi:hypothetical protein
MVCVLSEKVVRTKGYRAARRARACRVRLVTWTELLTAMWQKIILLGDE